MSANAKTVSIKKNYPVVVSTLFNAWVNADVAKGWLAPGSMKVAAIEIEPKASGTYRVEMKELSGESAQMDGQIKAYEENKKLIIQWHWANADLSTTLDISFRSISDSESEMHLIHSGFNTMDEMQNHQNGWKACCEKLSKVFT